jgi:amino acid adenylation domain-containing protein
LGRAVTDVPQTLASLWTPIAAQARRVPRHVAVRCSGADVTYAQLLEMVAAHNAGLAQHATYDGEVIALGAERTAQTIAALLAIVARGAAYLPLDAAHSDAWLAAMIEDARPRLGIGETRLRARLPSLAWSEPVNAASTIAARDGELAYVLFTSGSTGRPKGVAMRTRAVAHLIDWHCRHPRLGRAARTLQFAPLSFDVSFQEIFSTLATGGTLVLPSDAQRRDPWALLELIEQENIERIFLPYVALQGLAEAALSAARTPPALRDVITAGEQLRITPAIRALFAAKSDGVLHNHYGPTEAHVVTAHELSGNPRDWPELPPIGTPLPHVRVRIEPAQHAAADEGELLLGGDCLAAGYINRTQLTAERFVTLDGERWYRTGDGVRPNTRGELDYLGRLDDQIKIAGYRIEPAEIEAVLCRHAQIAEAAVVAQDTAAGKVLVAHVVPRDIGTDERALEHALREHCRALLAHYMQPQSFVAHTVLPQTASGKIDRRALANARRQHALAWNEAEPLDRQLAGLWSQLLGIERIDAKANLFELGATSLSVVHALAELRRHGRILSVAQIYEHPSIAAQIALLSGTSVQHADAPAARERGDRQREALARFARPGGRR